MTFHEVIIKFVYMQSFFLMEGQQVMPKQFRKTEDYIGTLISSIQLITFKTTYDFSDIFFITLFCRHIHSMSET